MAKMTDSEVAILNVYLTKMSADKDAMRNATNFAVFSYAHDYFMRDKSYMLAFIEQLVALNI